MSAAHHRRPRRYSELVQRPGDGQRQPIEVGCWVVVDRVPLELSHVVGGPRFAHLDGCVVGSAWLLADGEWHAGEAITRLDLDEILALGRDLSGKISAGKEPGIFADEILRIHRAACLADSARRTVSYALDLDRAALLSALVFVDAEVAALEEAWRQMVRVKLPILAANLAQVGLMEICRRSPVDWEPGDPGDLHPVLTARALDGSG